MKQFGLAVEGEDTQDSGASSTTGNTSVEEGKPVAKFDGAKAVSELNALQTLLENRYMNKV